MKFFFNFLKMQEICDSLVLFMSRKNCHVTQKFDFKNWKFSTLIRQQNFPTWIFLKFRWLKLKFRFVITLGSKKISKYHSKCPRNRGSKIGCFQKNIFNFLISGTLPSGVSWPIIASLDLYWPPMTSHDLTRNRLRVSMCVGDRRGNA